MLIKRTITILSMGITLFANELYVEKKIEVHEVPFGIVNNFKVENVDLLKSKKPLKGSIESNYSSNQTILTVDNKDITILVNKGAKPLAVYNSLLNIANDYADKNLDIADKKRVSKAISVAKLNYNKNSSNFNEKKESVEVIESFKDNVSSKIDFDTLPVGETLDYFISNYSNINTEPVSTNDVRGSLVNSLKAKLYSNPKIDIALINYSITLRELELLRMAIKN